MPTGDPPPAARAHAPAMTPDELAAWLRLLAVPRLGRIKLRRLLAAFGSPESACEASSSAWRDALGGERFTLPAPAEVAAQLAATLQWLHDDARHTVLSLADAAYPASLLALADPPLLLYASGRLDLLQQPALAIVGSRHPTPDGEDHARRFAAGLAEAGLTIVSGMAAGIDAAAHLGALGTPASTIAVVGTGLDRVYPASQRELAHRIAEQGLLLSEFALGTPAMAAHFPQRNRLIAAMGLGTLVVEAALRSGSLITARLAGEIGRDVFAIPGSIHSPQSKGCHALIKQGAKLVDTLDDILGELHLARAETRPVAEQSATAVKARDAAARAPIQPDPPLAETAIEADPVLRSMGYDPVSFDTLQLRTGQPASELNAALLELELMGRVRRLPGQIFQRVALV